MIDTTEEAALPPLREDIRLLPGPETNHGAPTWAIFDPVRNRYFRISWIAFELLSRWHVGSANQLLDKVHQETTSDPGIDDIRSMIQFLFSNNLTLTSPTASTQDFTSQYNATQNNRFSRLMRNYLFLRFPLVHPDVHLQKAMPYLEFLFSGWFRLSVMGLGLLGLLLINRQWEAFINTFLHFYSLEGLLFYLVALAFIKICHELGHAITATRFGCKVATMGVAFLVFFPVLYTDTTDAYRLTSRRKRLMISAAGILTEFYLALICLFLWGVLPEGVLRSVVFVLGTVSFTLTVLINLNPFLRFDGYYFLADWMGIENLQERSFALGRWRLRELLFDLGDRPPEPFRDRMRRFLIVFAWITWAYRFFLMATIALVVYYFFFKLLGLILFLGVVYIFIIAPIMKETTAWWLRRSEMSKFRGGTLLALVAGLFLIAFVPWRSTITAPAILEPALSATVYPPSPGKIKSLLVSEGDLVKKDDPILIMESPELAEELSRIRIEIKIIEISLDRVAASDTDLVNLQVLRQQLQERQSRVDALEALQRQLVLKSPINGQIEELANALHEGRWINESLAVGFVANQDSRLVKAMMKESDLNRVSQHQLAKFIPDDANITGVSGTVVSIDQANRGSMDQPYLASIYGGDIAVRQDSKGDLIPETTVYRLQLTIESAETLPDQVIRGVAKIEGDPKSFARRAYEIIAAAVVRGSAF